MMERTQPQEKSATIERGDLGNQGDTGKGGEKGSFDELSGPGGSKEWRENAKESGDLPAPEKTSAMSLLDDDAAGGRGAEARESTETKEAAGTRGEDRAEFRGTSSSLLDDDGGKGPPDLSRESFPEGARGIADEAKASGEAEKLREKHEPGDRE